MSSTTAHAWHHMHFLRRLTGGGDAMRQDRTGPWALQLNGAKHLSPHRQIPAPLMPEWAFLFYGLYWMPGGKDRRHSSMLGIKPVGQGRSKKGKPGLIPTGWGKAWVEVWKHLGQSGRKKQINTDRSSQQLAAEQNHNREAKAEH